MERLTGKDRREALEVILAETDKLTRWQAQRWLTYVGDLAMRLHGLYTKRCNEPLTPAEDRRTGYIEEELTAAFNRAGLGLYLNGDPRENPVGILTPKTGRCNTMGGRECGWRL